MKIILHTTNCPKCNILKSKLNSKNISFEENFDVKFLISKGFVSAPVLQVDDEYMDFSKANEWINNYQGQYMYNIGLDLNPDFERTLDSLRVKYGEEFEFLNGVHPSQLDYSEFLNKFISNNTLADSTIDPNANANHRDIRSFITEKGKPSDKLFGLNYVFKKMKQKWGIRTAREWFEQEYTKGFYLNDS